MRSTAGRKAEILKQEEPICPEKSERLLDTFTMETGSKYTYRTVAVCPGT